MVELERQLCLSLLGCQLMRAANWINYLGQGAFGGSWRNNQRQVVVWVITTVDEDPRAE